MLKTLRKRFAAAAMAGVTLLLLVLLGGINAVNWWLDYMDTDMLLTVLSEGGYREERRFFRPPLDEDDVLSAVYFSLYLDAKGEVRSADVTHIGTLDEAEAAAYAGALNGERTGSVDRFRYRVRQLRDGSVAVFLDVSQNRSSLLVVAALSLLAGAACWFAALLTVMLLSRRAVRPVAESLERQKRFITDAGHELKTPLAIIRANADALELHEGESRWSRNIRRQTERMDELTQRLLTLARLDEARGGGAAACEQDLSAAVEDAAAQYREPAQAAGLGLDLRLEPGLHIKAAPGEPEQLLDILLDNAVKYAEPGTRLGLSLGREGGRIQLSLRNRCAELPKEPERLFDRFYREDSARSRDTGGAGLGLAIARALAEDMDAELSASLPEEGVIEFTARWKPART